MEGTKGLTSSAAGATAMESLTPGDAAASPAGSTPASAPGDPVVALADEFLAWLATTTGAEVDDAVRIDRIAALERVKGALAAAQVRQTTAFAESQRASLPSWTPERTAVRSIGSQIALARRESPTRGDAHVALALALTQAMPQTLAALTAGQISEGAAEGIHRVVAGLDPAVRREVDTRLAPELGQLGERSLVEAARRVVADVDDEAATRRVERATRGRRVTLRTAPDGMAYLTLLAPMAEAAGAFQAVEAEATAILGEPTRAGGTCRRSAFWLADPAEQSPGAAGPGSAEQSAAAAPSRSAEHRTATPAKPVEAASGPSAVPSDSSRRGGESFFRSGAVRRTRSQLMADLVISRLTGQAIGQPVPIEIQLVMTDAALHHDAATDRDADGQGKPGGTAPSSAGCDNDDIGGRAGAGKTAGRSDAEPARRERRGESSEHPAFPRTTPAPDGPAGDETRPDTGARFASGRSAGDVPRHRPAPGTQPPTGNPAGDWPHPWPAPGGRPPSNSPAKIVGAGWLPAGFARELVRRTAAAGSDVTVRRVVTSGDHATVVGLEARRRRLNDARPRSGASSPLERPPDGHPSDDSNSALGSRVEGIWRPGPMPVLAPTGSMQRLFRGVLRRLVVVRDQACRTPFCAAAIRAVDHVTPARRDGPTCAHNAEGKCDRCNFTKEAPGWKVVVLSAPSVVHPDPSDPPWKQLMDELLAADEYQEHQPAQPTGSHRTAVITPTGHRYESTAPPVAEPGHSRPRAG